MGFQFPKVETADKGKCHERKIFFPYSILSSIDAYSTFMIAVTSKHNGVDYQSYTVETANKEKENESKFPFA